MKNTTHSKHKETATTLQMFQTLSLHVCVSCSRLGRKNRGEAFVLPVWMLVNATGCDTGWSSCLLGKIHQLFSPFKPADSNSKPQTASEMWGGWNGSERWKKAFQRATHLIFIVELLLQRHATTAWWADFSASATQGRRRRLSETSSFIMRINHALIKM